MEGRRGVDALTPKQFYEKLLGRQLPPVQSGENPNVSTQCFCGNHEGGVDSHESCSINLSNGLWFCHVTNSGGNMVQAYQKVHGCTRDEAKKAVKEADVRGSEVLAAHAEDLTNPNVIDQEIAELFARELVQDKKARERAIKDFGWSTDTMREMCIGYQKQTKRYTFPVYDDQNRLVNIRMYSPDATGKNKMINWSTADKSKKYGHARLWPIASLRAGTIVLCEGEKDCTIMNQVLRTNLVDGWAAITGTGGAGTWKDSWTDLFKNKRVIIIYDKDKSGMENAQSVAAKLFHVAMEVNIVTLDITEPANADITDYFVSSSKGWDDLKRLIDEADAYTLATKRRRQVGEKDLTVYKPHLSLASDKQYIGKLLEIKAMISGKDLAPFAVPAKVAFDCEMDMGKACESCAMKSSGGLIEMALPKDDPDLINLIKVPDHQMKAHIRARRGINTRCPRVDMEVLENHNIEEVTLVPELDFSELEREYVSRTAYVVEHGVIANRSYVLHGTAIPHPKTQHVTHFVPKIQEAQDSIDDFQMDERKLKMLRVFQPSDGQSVRDKFEEIARDLSLNVTKIYGREDIVMAVDLCYHTVLGFDLQDKPVGKAWGDIMIVGDTGTGKTETVQEMIRHYRLGELTVGENTSFAGLVGGLKQEAGKRWSITWGRWPLNDRRLLAIDEVSGLSTDDIGAMSGIRSSGIAEITKIVTQKTMARTRSVWISNPRSNRSMSQYQHGVEVMRDLIGRPEDIRRFDFVVSAATNEVPIEVINSMKHDQVDHVYTSDLCRMLVLWAWSRKSGDVHFTAGAVRSILELATEQSGKYASAGGIPLVEGGNQRIKLAKLAVAAACRTFSTKDGVQVDVKTEHVEFAARFLDDVYAKQSLDYLGFSRAILSKTNVPDELVALARAWIRDHAELAQLWTESNFLRVDDFKTQFDMETADVKKDIMAPLAKWRMIERGPSSTYKKTPAFIKLLKEEGEAVSVAATQAAEQDDDIPF